MNLLVLFASFISAYCVGGSDQVNEEFIDDEKQKLKLDIDSDLRMRDFKIKLRDECGYPEEKADKVVADLKEANANGDEALKNETRKFLLEGLNHQDDYIAECFRAWRTEIVVGKKIEDLLKTLYGQGMDALKKLNVSDSDIVAQIEQVCKDNFDGLIAKKDGYEWLRQNETGLFVNLMLVKRSLAEKTGKNVEDVNEILKKMGNTYDAKEVIKSYNEMKELFEKAINPAATLTPAKNDNSSGQRAVPFFAAIVVILLLLFVN